MSSINLKDDTGAWIVFGGITTQEDINWVLVTSNNFAVPATGGYYLIAATIDQNVFVILPAAPVNGTIVGVQVINNLSTYTYIQTSNTDTIDYQSMTVLLRNNGQLIERVRYYNGRWFRLDGNYNYASPPL